MSRHFQPTALRQHIGVIHFIGIGGIGMSGIAQLLHNLGHVVQGSDLQENDNIARLRSKNIKIMIGHAPENLGKAEVVVISSAVGEENCEIQTARARMIPVIRRTEMLAELMRFKSAIAIGGTHGKTTTTSMVACLLEQGGFDPTIVNGGVLNAHGANSYLGRGDWMVVEADESDGSFLHLPVHIAVVTNIDPEHMEYYGDYARLCTAYERFIRNIPFYGFALLCADHPQCRKIAGQIKDRKIITYGLSETADIQASNLQIENGGVKFDVTIHRRIRNQRHRIENLFLPMPGRHNVQNSLAAIAIADRIGIPDSKIIAGLAKFRGVWRRFSEVGDKDGAIRIFDDYAHHPVEIEATLCAARSLSPKRLIAVIQPHRYSRLHNLYDQFCHCARQADIVLISDIYSAGETPIAGIDRDFLITGMRNCGHLDVQGFAGFEDLGKILRQILQQGDLILCMGAGSITKWAQQLPVYLAPQIRSATPMGTKPSKEKRMIKISSHLHKLPVPEQTGSFRGRMMKNARLAPFTWFRVGGEAKWLFLPADHDDLSVLLQRCPADMSLTILGAGSNILIRDGGVDGSVIRLGRGFNQVAIDNAKPRIKLGASVLDSVAATRAAQAGIGGLEFLRGIPGTIGGAIIMNSGCYGRDIFSCLRWVEMMDREGRIHKIRARELQPAYRNGNLPPNMIVLSVELEGCYGPQDVIVNTMRQLLETRNESQPVSAKTGGSTFKNPPEQNAWRLIDQAGCRGMRLGEAMISSLHSNFMINTGNARALDLEALGEKVRQMVRDHCGVLLEWEIRRLGRFDKKAAVVHAI